MMKRLLAVGLTWLLPGAGHLLFGKVRKALYFFVLLEGAFLIGLALGGFRIVSFDRHPFYTLVFELNPIATTISWKLTESLRVTEEILTLELGCLFAGVASLLNVLVMIDAYDLAEREDRGRRDEIEPREEAAERPAPRHSDALESPEAKSPAGEAEVS